MFVEQKRCQVFTYESETFHRRGPNGISCCENGEQNPQSLPLSLARRGPPSIQQCLGLPHAPPQTAAPTVEALSHTYAVNFSIRYNGAPQMRSKSTPSRGPIAKPHYLPRYWTRPTYDAKRHPDPIRRFSTMHWFIFSCCMRWSKSDSVFINTRNSNKFTNTKNVWTVAETLFRRNCYVYTLIRFSILHPKTRQKTFVDS